MKLHTLILQNINALKGKWQIDFDDDEFYHQGIFAILGATGAGKTTILDAICLAIYGATPRLGKISKSENALMSIGAGECQASVELSVGDKRYQFTFMQRRAKNKSDGALQEPTHQISEYKNNEFLPISEKKSHSEKLAPQILGMDFVQFTRSVMLAQGGFSAFLQSKPEERGEILEKITGTDIYAKISIKVYELFKQKEEALKLTQAKLGDIRPMSDDELALLKNQLDDYANQKNHLNTALQNIDGQIKQKTTYNDLLSEKQNIQEQLLKINNDLANFDNQTLEKAKQYAIILPIFDKLNDLSRQKDELSANHQTISKKLTSLTQNLDTKKQEIVNFENALNQVQTHHNDWQPKLAKLKQLTAEIEKLNNEQQHFSHYFNEAKNTVDDFNQKLAQHNQRLLEQQNLQNTNQSLLTHYQTIANIHLDNELRLPANIYLNTNEKLNKNLSDLKQKQQKILNLKDEKSKTENTLNTHNDAVNSKKLQLDNTANDLKKLLKINLNDDIQENDFHQILNTMDNELENTREHYRLLNDFFKNYQNLIHKQTQYQDNKEVLNQETLTVNQSKHQYEKDKELVAQLQKTYELHQEQYQLYNEIQRLGDYIHTLNDGTPCPLCGATNHPYKHNPPNNRDIAIAKQTLDNKKQDYENAKHALENSQNAIIKQESQIEHLMRALENLNQEITLQHNQLANEWCAICQTITTPIFDNPIMMDNQKFNNEYLTSLLNNLNQSGILLKEKYQSTTTLYQQYQSQKNELRDVEYQLIQAQNECTTIETQIQALNAEWKAMHNELSIIFDELTHCTPLLQKFIQQHQHQIVNFTNQTMDNTILISAIETLDKMHALYQNKLTANTLPIFYDNGDWLMNNKSTITNALNQLITNSHNAIEHYRQKNIEQQQLISDINNTNVQINDIVAQLKIWQEKLNAEQQKIIAHQNTLSQLNAQKIQEYGDINAEHQEKQLNEQLQTHKETLNQAKHHLDLINNDIIHHQKLLDDNLVHQNNHHHALETQQAIFNEKLSVYFGHIDEFLSARIDDDKLEMLQNQWDNLQKNTQIINAKAQENHQQLTKMLGHYPDIADWQLDDLTAIQKDNQAKLEHLLTQIGSQETLYQQHLNTVANYQKLKDELQAFEKDISIYHTLNSLIGSHDGKKYRNFAQTLTLQALLNEANQVLQKMSNRYELMASSDVKNILGIEIKDKHQGDAIRQSKNLSGGESFIVSLSLALGLSAMSSQNMQIDSLFLDEGFGTLDEDALNIALDTLGEIQAGGKMIGIISHISTLKERIGTQILVNKVSNGKSELTGAGVKKIE